MSWSRSARDPFSCRARSRRRARQLFCKPEYRCKVTRMSVFTTKTGLIRLLSFRNSRGRRVEQYPNIVVGDVSRLRLANARMAESVLDSGWGKLKTQLHYQGQQAGRSVQVVSESDSTRVCGNGGALTGSKGVGQLVVRPWVCRACGDTHDRDVNAARNLLAGFRCGPPCAGTSPRAHPIAQSSASSARKARTDRVRAAA